MSPATTQVLHAGSRGEGATPFTVHRVHQCNAGSVQPGGYAHTCVFLWYNTTAAHYIMRTPFIPTIFPITSLFSGMSSSCTWPAFCPLLLLAAADDPGFALLSANSGTSSSLLAIHTSCCCCCNRATRRVATIGCCTMLLLHEVLLLFASCCCWRISW